MALLQIVAAHMAQISHLIFHTYDSSGNYALMDAKALLDELLESEETCTTDNLIRRVLAEHFEWGTSDGN